MKYEILILNTKQLLVCKQKKQRRPLYSVYLH